MRRRVLVTGGAGFIGSALSNKLSDSSDVTAVDNLKSGDWSRCKSEVQKVNLDLSKLSLIELCTLLADYDDLYHLAAVKLHNEENSFEDILDNNVVSTSRLFEAAGLAGIKNVFFSSSLYAYGSMGPDIMNETDIPIPKTYYGASKLFGEIALEIAADKYGFRDVCARFFFIYGPKQFSDGGYKSVIVRNFENALAGQPLTIFGDGDQSLDYVYIDDCISIIEKLMKSDFSGVVNLASGVPVKIRQLVSMIQEITSVQEVIHCKPDFTQGSVRFGSNDKLQAIIGGFEFLDVSQGLIRTWTSMIGDPKSYD